MDPTQGFQTSSVEIDVPFKGVLFSLRMTGTDNLDWLMAGDPAIRWQAMRDLAGKAKRTYHPERRRVGEVGWGQRLLHLQAADGRWSTCAGPRQFRGLYIPKWTSTTYTLLELRRLGLEPRHPRGLAACTVLVQQSQWLDDDSVAPWNTARTDICVCGMFLGLLEWFKHPSRRRRDSLLAFLLAAQKEDGGWNCDTRSEVASMHTTISVLEALQLRRLNCPSKALDGAMARGHDYLLARRLHRSLRTGKVIKADFSRFPFFPRWKYDLLRALDHLRDAGTKPDERAAEAIEILRSKQRKDGTWGLHSPYSGVRHFDPEKGRNPSRWNTLRARRVLAWWEGR